MKLQAIFLSLITLFTFDGQLFAQTTSFGTGAGTLGFDNSYFGANAGASSTSSSFYNTAVGKDALYSNTSGGGNIAVGFIALKDNTLGDVNTAIGNWSLRYNTTGSRNISIGTNSMTYNTAGEENVSIGWYATFSNTTGNYNVGIGSKALFENETGVGNTALGYQAAYNTTTGNYGTALGYRALHANTEGYRNAAIGDNTLSSNTTGNSNVGVGSYALLNNTTGSFNIGIGGYAGYYSSSSIDATSIGYGAGSYSNYNNTTALGAFANTTASNQVRVGNTSVTSIGGYANWTLVSDGRFKSEVEENVMGLDFINALRPVSYKLNRDKIAQFLHQDKNSPFLREELLQAQGEYQTGFIAQEVEATAKALGFEHFNGVDVPTNENSHYGLRYAEFVVPLVKSVQELSAQTEEQAATIEDLKALVVQQQKQLDALLGQTNTSSTVNATNEVARLAQNQPNPFSEETNIQVFIPETTAQAAIMISNLEGKQIEMVNVEQRGTATITLAANKLSPGLYLYTLVIDNEIIDSKKMLIIE